MADANKDQIGKRIWYEDLELCWIPLLVTSVSAKFIEGEFKGKKFKVKKGTYETVDEAAIGVDVADIVELTQICEGSVITLIGARYVQDKIYTKLGQILIVVNPYKAIVADMETYKKCSNDPQIDALEPHNYGTAMRAWNYCAQFKKNQSIIISGESGAGKTESTKICLELLSNIGGGGTIATKMMQSSPILECFGNAKTVRNNNSSRFGKWMQLIIEHKRIVGTVIINYLLEKSRITAVGKDERNYHAFYSLLASPLAAKFGIDADANQYRILTMGGCVTSPGIDDLEFYNECGESFVGLNLDAAAVDSIWEITANCLLLGQLEYVDKGELCEVRNADLAAKCAKLVGVDEAQFLAACTSKKLVVMGAETICSMSRENSVNQKGSFARDIYNRFFNWIVFNCNLSINQDGTTEGIGVGVLDIFGFEIFDENLFEQFCINWANERLQHQFNQYTFNSQVDLMEGDGVSCAGLTFEGNDRCIELIEKKRVGLVALIVDECTVPKGSDEQLIKKIMKQHAKHPFFQRAKKKKKKKDKKEKKDGPPDFAVRHFVEPVAYSFVGCLETNRDKTPLIYIDLMKTSKVDFVRALYEEGGKSKAKTVAEAFKSQLGTLMKTMNATHPHYVRCVKPNTLKKKGYYDPNKTIIQLRASGVFEVIRVRSSLLSYNLTHEEFLRRFRLAMAPEDKIAVQGTMPRIDALLKHLKQKRGLKVGKDIKKGTSMLFWNDEARVILSEEVELGMIGSILVLQSLCNVLYIRKNYSAMLMVRKGLRDAFDREDWDAMAHWKGVCEELGFHTVMDYHMRVQCLFDLKVAQQTDDLDELTRLLALGGELVAQTTLGKEVVVLIDSWQWEMPIRDILAKAENVSGRMIAPLSTAIKQAERHYPEGDILRDGRELLREMMSLKKKSAVATDWLETALKTQVLEDLQSALKYAMGIRLNDAELMKAAKERYNEEMLLRSKMKTVCRSSDVNLYYYLAKDNMTRYQNAERGASNRDFQSSLPMRSSVKKQRTGIAKTRNKMAAVAVSAMDAGAPGEDKENESLLRLRGLKHEMERLKTKLKLEKARAMKYKVIHQRLEQKLQNNPTQGLKDQSEAAVEEMSKHAHAYSDLVKTIKGKREEFNIVRKLAGL